MNFKALSLAVCATLLMLPLHWDSALAASRKKQRKTAATPVAAAPAPAPRPKPDPFQTFLKDVTDRAESDGLDLYRTSKGKLFLGFPKAWLGRRMLAGGTVTTVSDPGAMSTGHQLTPPLCLEVGLSDSLVVLTRPFTGASTEDPEMALAMERNYVPVVWRRIPLTAWGPDSTLVFDVTPLMSAVAPKGSDFNVSKDDKTAWFGPVKAFGDNASVVLHQNMDITGAGGMKAQGTMSSTVSFLLLPADPMRPRIQDSRIGTFSTLGYAGNARYDLSSRRDAIRGYRIANRWRIEPSDTAAWLRGETVPVKDPVVWYVDDAFPELWKEPVRRGVLAWNEAFEQFGLKDALQVRDFPRDDPAFDPDNIKYHCIRYIPNNTMNAMGPSWADPVTGEIVGAVVLVFNDVVRLINNWRFVQTAQVDPRVRSVKMPDDVLQESLVYVVSHEIGHTLGLLHNMGSSAAIPVDSLRDAAFTAIHGTTPSIMDYARFNYVAQPGDEGVRLTPPSLGVYDRYAIRWLYCPVPQAQDMWEEARIAERLIDAHAGDPWYRFGPQAPSAGVSYDPSSRTQDIGDDPVKAGEYGIRNLRYILPRMNEWITGDEGLTHRKELYSQLVTQHGRYLAHAMARIGGIYLNKVKDGTPGTPAVAVPREDQRAALRWVVRQVRESGWLNEPSVVGKLGLMAPQSNRNASTVATWLGGTAVTQVQLSARYSDKPYTLRDYFDDLYKEVFPTGGRALTSEEKTLQKGLVTAFARPLIPAGGKAAFDEGFAPEEEADFCGFDDSAFGESDLPQFGSVDISSIDESTGYKRLFIGRILQLARTLRRSAPADDRAHYEYLYMAASAALGEK